MMIPSFYWLLKNNSAIGAANVFGSATAKFHQSGLVQWSDFGTHNIAKIGWRSGPSAWVLNAASSARISLQNTTTNNVPDTNVDEYALYTSVTKPATNTGVESILNTPRNGVASGSRLSVVWDFAAYNASDSMSVAIPTSSSQATVHHDFGAQNVSSGAWGNNSSTFYGPNVYFVSDDAVPVYGILLGSHPFSAVNFHMFNSGSTPAIYGMEVIAPCSAKVRGVRLDLSAFATGADFNISIRNAANAEIGAASVLVSNLVAPASTAYMEIPLNAAVDMTKDSTYYALLVPTTTNNITVYSHDVLHNELLDLIGGKDAFATKNFTFVTLTGSTYTKNPNRQLRMGLLLSDVSTGGGGGGLIANLGMNGGLNS